MDDEHRRRFWLRQGANDDQAAELTAYAQSGFDPSVFERVVDCPLPDEPFVEAWDGYVAIAAERGAAAMLRQPFVQLRFPIAEGMSESPAYVAAVRRNEWCGDTAAPGVSFVRPEALDVRMHATAVGRLPVIVAGAREDFVSLVQALTCRNEPRPVSSAMGACIVAGYNNWDRLAALGPLTPAVIGNRALYQDRFIILSSGPYSGVAAADVGLGVEEWLRLSLTIRLEHECAHYVTRHALGTMRNSILDELIADHAGIVGATGRYRADWFLRFLGIDSPSACRVDGRIHTYRGTPPLSDGAFAIVPGVVRRAAAQLEAFERLRPRTERGPIETARTIVALAKTGLEGLASGDAHDRLREAIAAAASVIRDRACPASIA